MTSLLVQNDILSNILNGVINNQFTNLEEDLEFHEVSPNRRKKKTEDNKKKKNKEKELFSLKRKK